MDQQRERIQEDLRGLLAGDVRCDDVTVQMYASDASIFQIRPRGVIRPRSTADVTALLRYATENQIAVHARGAGTGLAGESLGGGLVVDFSCHLRRILHTTESTVRVQPGVVLERLNQQLRSAGRMFGPDPAMHHVTTLGSVVALDAAGSHWLKYGSTRRHVQNMQIVLPDGSVMEVGREPLFGGQSFDPDQRKRALVNGVVKVLQGRAELISRHQPRSLVNRSGYQLQNVLRDDELDLVGLLVGSEGTLALFTEITLDTQPVPRHQGMALLLFDRLELAAKALPGILARQPAACDLMDRRHLSLAREGDSRYDSLIPQTTEALLLVEFHGDDAPAVRDHVRHVIEEVRHDLHLAFDFRQTFSRDETDLFWQLARRVVPTLYRLKGSTRAVPFVEDMAVPPDALAGFLVDMQNVLKKHQVTATLFAHAGHGQLHLRPFLDLDNPEHVQVLSRLAEDLYAAVWAVGGTISGEHGDGLSRTAYLPGQYGELYSVLREIKHVFDPTGILNPGKVVGDDPGLLTRNHRPALHPTPLAVEQPPAPAENGADRKVTIVPLQLRWTEGELSQSVKACNGCGSCRTQSAGTRMCPIFRFAPQEESSPRAKANLLRAVLAGELDPKSLLSDEMKSVADLCVNCQMCRLECPAGVDIPRLVVEAKAAFVENNGLSSSDWVMTRLDLLASLGGLVSPLANWALSNRQARWLLEKCTGIAQGRKLPRFAARSFMRRAHRQRLTRPTRRSGRKVLYFVDTYANYHDPQLAEALVRVMEHNGVAVFVHPGQIQSAMAMVSLGAVERARKVAKQNVELLADGIRQGYEIVASEPSAALCVRREYPALLDTDDARLVAQSTFDGCQYLWDLHQADKLQLDFRPVNASLGYHQPCHLKALQIGSPGESLVRLVPGISLQHVEKGCSGMAGTFGLKRENYRSSLRAGWPLISAVRESTWQAGLTECSACKMQMEQGTTKPTIHPLKILALAYGLMPEAASLLSVRGEELVVT